MPDFTFTARQQSGKVQKGTLTAQNRAAAIAALHSKQLTPLIVKDAKAGGVSLSMNISIPGFDGVRAKDRVIFTRELSTMINAGVPIVRALNVLKEQNESVALSKVLDDITEDVQGGKPLSTAIAKHPKVFSAIYVNMVRAGETGGILDEVLKRLAYQEEKDAVLRGKIRSAMAYPTVVFSVTIVAFFVLMTFIVPKIGTILTQLTGGKKLPVYTRALLAVSNFCRQPLFLVALLVGGPLLVYAFRRYIKTEKGRYRWHSIILRIPAVKVIITKAAVARFARTFASLMSAGVSIVEAIDTTAGAIGNAVIEKELRDCSKAVEAGHELSAELRKSKFFPPIVAQMLSVGEETGKTDEVILKIAEFYEEEVDTAVNTLSSIIEPVMIILLGTMVGIIAVAVYVPIAQLGS